MTRLTMTKKDKFSNPEDFDAIKKASDKLLANMKQIAKQEREENQDALTKTSSITLTKSKSLDSNKS